MGKGQQHATQPVQQTAQSPPPYIDGSPSGGDRGWNPSHEPVDDVKMGFQTPQSYDQSRQLGYGQHPQMSPYGAPPVSNERGQYGAIVDMCPATGGPHSTKRRPGPCGIIIGICFCPIGLIAIPFDQRVECRNCRQVIKPDWCG